MPTFDEWVAIMLPIYSKYYNVAEIQKLIKFYSIEDMQNMLHKDALIGKELDAIWVKKMAETMDKAIKRLEESSKENVTK